MGRLYKINQPCPKCHEEHNWWHGNESDGAGAVNLSYQTHKK